MGYFLGIDPVLGAIGFSLASALGIGVVSRRTHQRVDTVIGVMWAIGMALGIILIDLTPGYAADLMSYLFGSILTVPSFDVLLMLLLDGVIISVVALLYKEFLVLSFDEEFATVIGIPVERLYLILLCLVAITVVMLMRIVGLILVIALLTIPAAISGQFTSNLKKMMLLSTLLGIAFTTSGLWLSYAFDLTSGATIILVAGVAFLLASSYRNIARRRAQA